MVPEEHLASSIRWVIENLDLTDGAEAIAAPVLYPQRRLFRPSGLWLRDRRDLDP